MSTIHTISNSGESADYRATDLWTPSHGAFDSNLALARVEDFATKVSAAGHEVTDVMYDSTVRMITDSYNKFEDSKPDRELAGGHAFIVPTRIRPDVKALNEAYRSLPILEAIDEARFNPEVAAQFGSFALKLLEALPPKIIDRYEGSPGAVIYAPLTSLLLEDFASTTDAIAEARYIVSQTVGFAERLGAEVAGLGATIPSLTNYGRAIKLPEDGKMVVTTGHGGTAWLAGNIAAEAYLNNNDDTRSLGIVGLGAMGSVLAETVSAMLPDAEIAVYDHNTALIEKTKANLGNRVIAAKSMEDVMARSSVILSALTSQIDLSSVPRELIEGKTIVDDSQPGAFSRQQVIDMGGRLLWVVAQSTNGLSRETDLNFGGTLRTQRDFFGCEAEAAVIATLSEDDRSKAAIRQAATLDQVMNIGRLFKDNHIIPSEPQSYGQPA